MVYFSRTSCYDNNRWSCLQTHDGARIDAVVVHCRWKHGQTSEYDRLVVTVKKKKFIIKKLLFTVDVLVLSTLI